MSAYLNEGAQWNYDMDIVPRDGQPVLLKIKKGEGETYPQVGIMFPLNEMDGAKWWSLVDLDVCKRRTSIPIAWRKIEE